MWHVRHAYNIPPPNSGHPLARCIPFFSADPASKSFPPHLPSKEIKFRGGFQISFLGIWPTSPDLPSLYKGTSQRSTSPRQTPHQFILLVMWTFILCIRFKKLCTWSSSQLLKSLENLGFQPTKTPSRTHTSPAQLPLEVAKEYKRYAHTFELE